MGALEASACLEGWPVCMNLWKLCLTRCKSSMKGLFVCKAMRSNYFSEIDNPTEKVLVNNLALILIVPSSGRRFICLGHLEQGQNLRELLKYIWIWVSPTQGIYTLFQLQTLGIAGIRLACGKISVAFWSRASTENFIQVLKTCLKFSVYLLATWSVLLKLPDAPVKAQYIVPRLLIENYNLCSYLCQEHSQYSLSVNDQNV